MAVRRIECCPQYGGPSLLGVTDTRASLSLPKAYFARKTNWNLGPILLIIWALLGLRSTRIIWEEIFPNWNRLPHGIRLASRVSSPCPAAVLPGVVFLPLPNCALGHVHARPPRAVLREPSSWRPTRLPLDRSRRTGFKLPQLGRWTS